MSPFLAFVLTQQGPLDRLAGDWTSLETVETREGKKALRLKGKNRWVFKDALLEIDEEYTIDGDPKPRQNHILMRALEGGKLAMWWHTPEGAEPLVFDGTVEEGGLTFTRKDGRMRIVYRWDGDKAYDAKLQTRRADEETWTDRTVARYTKR